MLVLPKKSPREIEKACAAALFNPVEWIRLTDRLPAPREHVMVKMDDEIVEIRYWDPTKAGWSQNPFESSGIPIAWAALPRIQPLIELGRTAA